MARPSPQVSQPAAERGAQCAQPRGNGPHLGAGSVLLEQAAGAAGAGGDCGGGDGAAAHRSGVPVAALLFVYCQRVGGSGDAPHLEQRVQVREHIKYIVNIKFFITVGKNTLTALSFLPILKFSLFMVAAAILLCRCLSRFSALSVMMV